MSATTLDGLAIYELATIIHNDWVKPNYAAVPYIEAMLSLENIEDFYGLDSARSVVSYFLSNAASWRGAEARAVKAELKRRVR